MMSFLERIQARIHHAPAPTTKKTRQNVTHNRFDKKMWADARDLREVSRLVTDLMVGAGPRPGYFNAPELLEDVTYALYKADPYLVDPALVEEDARLNRAIIEELQNNPYFGDLRELSVLDETLTTIALLELGPTIAAILEQEKEQAGQSNEARQQADKQDGEGQAGDGDEGEGEEGGGEEEGEREGDGEGEGQPDEQEGEGENEGAGEGGGEDEEEEEGEGEGESEQPLQLDPSSAQALNRAIRSATEKGEHLQTIMAGIGLEEGEWLQMSPDERLKLAERLDTKDLRDLSELIGRMKRFAMGQQAQKITDAPHEPVGIITGDDIKNVLGSEFALLEDEVTEWEFYRRFAERELLQRQLRGVEKAGKGPIIVTIDKSASMRGEPFHWAMAVAEALRRICQEQKRDYVAIFFGNNDDRNVFEFPRGGNDYKKVLDFLSVAPTGGTQFDGVLDDALARVLVASDSEDVSKSDIVHITDGLANLTDEWLETFNEERTKVSCRTFGIFIGGADDMFGSRSRGIKVLEGFCDHVISVDELTTTSTGELFAVV